MAPAPESGLEPRQLPGSTCPRNAQAKVPIALCLCLCDSRSRLGASPPPWGDTSHCSPAEQTGQACGAGLHADVTVSSQSDL